MKKVLKIFGFAVLGITAVIGLAIGGFALFGGFKQEKIEISKLYFEDENGVTSDTLYLYGVLDEEMINIKYEPKNATETKLKFTPVGSATAPMLDMSKLEKARANESFAISPTKKLDGKNVGGSVKLKVSSVNNDNCFCYIYVVVDVEVDDNTIDFKAPHLITQIDTEVGYAKSYLAKKASNQNISLNAPDSNGLNIDTSAIAKGVKKDVYLDYDPDKISITKLDNNNKVVASVVSGSIINKVVSKDAVENSIDYLDIFYDRRNNKYDFTINPTDKTGNTKITMRMHRTFKIQEEYNAKFVLKEEIIDGNYRYIKYTSVFEQYKDLTSAEIDTMERTNPTEFAEYKQLVNEYNEFLNKYLKYFIQTENAKNFFYSYITDGVLTLDYKKPEEQILKSINFVFVEESIYLYVTDVEVGALKVGNHGKSNIFYVSENVKYTLSQLITDGIYNDEGSLKYQPFNITIEADNSNETNPTIILENNLAVQSMLSNLEVDVYAYTITGTQIRVDIANNQSNGLKDGNKNAETNFGRDFSGLGLGDQESDKNIWWRDDNVSPEQLIVLNKNFLEVVKNEDNTFTFIPKVPTEYLQNLNSDINLYLRFRLKVESAEYGTGYFYDYSYVKVSYKNVSNFTMGNLSNMTINEGDSLKYQGEQRTQLLTSTTIKKEDSPYNQVYYFVESSSNIKDAENLIYHVNVLKDKNGKAIEFGFLNLAKKEIDSVLEDEKRLTGHLICIPDDEEESQYIFNKIMALNITGSFKDSNMIENPIKVFAVVLLTDRDGNPITNMGERIDLLSQEVSTDPDSPNALRNLFVINYPKSINDIKQIKTEYILDRLYYYTKSENDQPYYYEEYASGVGTVLNTVQKGEYFLRNNRPLEVESKYTTLKLLAEDKYEDLVTVSPLQLDSAGGIITSTEVDEYGNNIDVLYNVLYTFTKAFDNEEFIFVFEGPSSDKTFAEVYNRSVTVEDLDAVEGEGSEGSEIEITDYFNFELLNDTSNFKKNFKLNVRTLGEESGKNTINLKEINYSYNNCSGVMDGAVATVINYINVSSINTIFHNDRDDNGVSKDQVILENIFKFETEDGTTNVIPGLTTWQIATDANQNEFFFNYYVTDAHYTIAEKLYYHYKDSNPTYAEMARQLMNRTIYTDFRRDFAVIYGDFATLLDCWDGDEPNQVNTLLEYDTNSILSCGSSWNLLLATIIDKIDSAYIEENTSLVYELLESNKDALSFDVSVDLFTHLKTTEEVLITDINDIYELIFANMILNNDVAVGFDTYKNNVNKENKILFGADLKDEKGLKEEYRYINSSNSIINLYIKNTAIREIINNFYPERVLISDTIKNDYESLFAVINALKLVVENSEINKSGLTVEDIEKDTNLDLNTIKDTYNKTLDDESTTDANEKDKVIEVVYTYIKENIVKVLLYASIGTPYVTYHNGYAEYYSGLNIETVNTSDNITNEGQYQRLKNIVRTLNLMLEKEKEISENLTSVKEILQSRFTYSSATNSVYTTESGKQLTLGGVLVFYTKLLDLIKDQKYQSNVLSLEEYKAQVAKEHSDNPNYVTENEEKIIREYVTMLIETKVDSSFSDLIISNAIKNVTSNANSDSLVNIKYLQKNEELRKYFEYIDANGEIIVENDGYISFIPSVAGNEISKDDYVMIGGTFDYITNPETLNSNYQADEDGYIRYSLQTAQFNLAEVGENGYYTRNVTYIHKNQMQQLSLNNLYNLVYFEIGNDMFSPEGEQNRILDSELSNYYNNGQYLKPVHVWRNDLGYYEFVQEYNKNNIESNLSNYIDVTDIFAINNTNGEYYQIIYYIYVGETTRVEDSEDPIKSIKVYTLNGETAEFEVNSQGKYYYNWVASLANPAYRAYVQHIELPVTVVASFYPYFSDGVQQFRSVHEKEFIFKLKFEVREPVISSYVYTDNKYNIGGADSSYDYYSYEYYVESINFVKGIDDITKYGVVEFKDAANDSVVKYIYDEANSTFSLANGSAVNYYDLYLNGHKVVQNNPTLIGLINGLESKIQPKEQTMIPLNNLDIAVIEGRSRTTTKTTDGQYPGLYNVNADGSINLDPIHEDGRYMFMYELYYNGEGIHGNATAESIWAKYKDVLESNELVVVNSTNSTETYGYDEYYNKVKYGINKDKNGLFDKDQNSKNFKFNIVTVNESPNGQYDMYIETTSGNYAVFEFESKADSSDAYYKINNKGEMVFDGSGLGDYNVTLGGKVIKYDLTNAQTSKVIYTKYGNFVKVEDGDKYLDAEFARQKLNNTTTNQYVVYGNTQIELSDLINFKQKENSDSLIPHIKFKVSNIQSGSEVAYFINANAGNMEQSEQIGYNNYLAYNRETAEIRTSTNSSDKVTLYFRDTNSVKYINLDMYLIIGSQEIKFYTYYITVNPSITLIGIKNNYVEVNSGQDNIDLDIAIKQVVNEVGTMVNYGEYGYAIDSDAIPYYLSVNQLNSEDQEYETGYKIFSTMSLSQIYNRTDEKFELIVCYKNGDNWVIPKDSSYKITVKVRPTYMVTPTTFESNPLETIYYENRGVSDVKSFKLDDLGLFSINRNTLNDQSINAQKPQLTYSIAEDQNDAVKDILGNIKLSDSGVLTFENPINFDFILKIKATYGIGDQIEEDFAYIKFYAMNLYYDQPNLYYGENNTDKLGLGSLPLDSEEGYKLADNVDSSFLNQESVVNVTLMANNTYDLRTIINLMYATKDNSDESYQTKNPVYVGFNMDSAKNDTRPIGTTLISDSQSGYAGIPYKLTIPRIYDLTTNKIVVDIYAYIVTDATSRIAYDTGRDLIINIIPDYDISLNNDNSTKPIKAISTINGTNFYGLEILNGKSILEIENLFNVTSRIYGTSLYDEKDFNKNEFFKKAVSIGYDVDNMTDIDDKYYIIESDISFKEINLERAIDVVKLISGIPTTELDSKVPLTFKDGVVSITSFAYDDLTEGYYNVLVPFVIKNNSLSVESQLLNKDQLYIKIANTNLSLESSIPEVDRVLKIPAGTIDTLSYEGTEKIDSLNLADYVKFNFTENGFNDDYTNNYASYLLNIKLADGYNNNFYKSFVNIKTRKIDTNGDNVLDYVVSDLISISPSINSNIELVLEIDYIFVTTTSTMVEGEEHITYTILDTLNNNDQVKLRIVAGYTVEIDESKLDSISQAEVKDEESVTTEGLNLSENVYSIYNYQNIFASDLFVVSKIDGTLISDLEEKINIASQGITSYNFANGTYYKYDTNNNKWVSVYKYELGTMSIDKNGRLEIKDLGYDILVPVEFKIYDGNNIESIETKTIYLKISSNVVNQVLDTSDSSTGLNEYYRVNGVDYLAGRGTLNGEATYELTANINIPTLTIEDEVAPASEGTNDIKVQYFFNFQIVSVNGKKVENNKYVTQSGEEIITLTDGETIGSQIFNNKLIFKCLTKEYKIELSYNYYIITFVNVEVDSIIEIPCNKKITIYALPNIKIHNINEILLGADSEGDIKGYAILNNQTIFTKPNETEVRDSNGDVLINGTIVYPIGYSSASGIFGFDSNKINNYGVNDGNYKNILKSKVVLKYSSTETYRKWDSSNNAYINYSNTATAQGDIFIVETIDGVVRNRTVESLKEDGIVSIRQLDYDVILPIELWVEGELIDILYIKVYSCFVADMEGNKVADITINSGVSVDFTTYKYSSIGSSLLDEDSNYEVIYNYRLNSLDDITSGITTESIDVNSKLKENLFKYYQFIDSEIQRLDTNINGIVEDSEYFVDFDQTTLDGIVSDDEFKYAFVNNKFKLTGVDDTQFDNENLLGDVRESVYDYLKDRENFSLYDSNVLIRLQRYFNVVYGANIGTDNQLAIWSDFINMLYNNNDFDGFITKYKELNPVLEGKTPNLEQELLMFAYRNLIAREASVVLQYNSLIDIFNKLSINGGDIDATTYVVDLEIDVVEKGQIYGDYIKSKTYLEGTKFERDSDESNDNVDKFSAWLENYLDETLNNYKSEIMSDYNSNDFNWDNFINDNAKLINLDVKDLLEEGKTEADYSSEEEIQMILEFKKQVLEEKMYEYSLKNFAISVCGNDSVLGNLYYHYILTNSNTEEFNAEIESLYSIGTTDLSFITNINFTGLTFGAEENSKKYSILVDAYIVEKLVDTKTGINYYKFINKYESVTSIDVTINKTNS